MYAKLGIILLSSMRRAVLVDVPKEVRSWGGESHEVGDPACLYPPLSEVRFKVHAAKGFFQRNLPAALQTQEAEFISMDGIGVEVYEAWVRGLKEDAPPGYHPFEAGLMSLLSHVGTCAVMLAPDNDRLEDFVVLQAPGLIDLLRSNMRNLEVARGFVATMQIGA